MKGTPKGTHHLEEKDQRHGHPMYVFMSLTFKAISEDPKGTHHLDADK